VDRPEFDRWREAAADAGRAAGIQRTAGMHNWACFLAEQSAQLAVKGLLHGIGTGPWWHDLVALGELGHDSITISVGAGQSAATAADRASRHRPRDR
jgi:HEPN domain-containing protein